MKRRESAAADLARLTMTLHALVEVGGECWRGPECELCGGVKTGLTTVARHTQVASDLVEQRVSDGVYLSFRLETNTMIGACVVADDVRGFEGEQ